MNDFSLHIAIKTNESREAGNHEQHRILILPKKTTNCLAQLLPDQPG